MVPIVPSPSSSCVTPRFLLLSPPTPLLGKCEKNQSSHANAHS
jgi:hypothetical protein